MGSAGLAVKTSASTKIKYIPIMSDKRCYYCNKALSEGEVELSYSGVDESYRCFSCLDLVFQYIRVNNYQNNLLV